MIITSLKLSTGLFDKEFKFSSKFNLIHSINNSVGKSSLLRLILFALGFNIPSTKGINFNKLDLSINIIGDNNKQYTLNRKFNTITIKQNNYSETFSLPSQVFLLHAKIFDIENNNILKNLLGVFYIDQERGWTLLNRGTPIGSNHFNIETFLQGISNIDCKNLYLEIDSLSKEISKYRLLFNVKEYKKHINHSLLNDKDIDIIENKIHCLSFEKESYKQELTRLKEVLSNNSKFVEFISKMKLYVKDSNGKQIPVNENTICGFDDSEEYIRTKIDITNDKISQIDNKLYILKQKKEKEYELIKVEDLIEKFDKNILNINLDNVNIKNIINELETKKTKIHNEIIEQTKQNNKLIRTLYEYISKYAIELGIEKNHISPNYIFTSDLQSLSGAIYHKISFAFKLAYLKIVEKYCSVLLPIILDSPKGKEIDDDNIKRMLEILERDFYNHQIIIASIYKYDIKDLNIIELKKCLTE